jgi:hypothetical protein
MMVRSPSRFFALDTARVERGMVKSVHFLEFV